MRKIISFMHISFDGLVAGPKDNLQGSLNELKQQGDQEILLFGSPTATHSLIEQNLIDGYWLFVNPIILGQGIPLFTGSTAKTQLKLLATHQFTCGVTEFNYIVDKHKN